MSHIFSTCFTYYNFIRQLGLQVSHVEILPCFVVCVTLNGIIICVINIMMY